MNNCIVCGRLTKFACQLCKTTYYCSKQHQKQHWERHKALCSGHTKPDLTGSHSESDNKANSSAKSRLTNARPDPTPTKPQIQRQLFTQPDSMTQSPNVGFGSTSTKQTPPTSTKPTVEDISARVDHFLELDERRKEDRRSLLLDYVKAKEDTLVTKGIALLKLSRQIEQHFSNDLSPFLFRQYRVRTTQLLQRLECILDATYLGKLLLKQNDRERLKELLFDLELPEAPKRLEPTMSELNHPDVEAFKTYRLEVQNYRKCLSLLASISNAGGFVNFTQKMYYKYILLIEESAGTNEQFVAYYMVGLWYAEIGQFNKAIKCFEHCLLLKEQPRKFEPHEIAPERPSEMLVANCYYNLALCQRTVNQIGESLESMLKCLSIRRQEPANNKLELADCLEFVAKQLLEQNKNEESIDYLNECHRIRMDLLKMDDPSLLRVKDLVRLLYRQALKNSREQGSMKKVDNTNRTVSRLTEIIRRDYPEIETYIDHLRKKEKTQLGIKIDLEWFNDMKPQDLESLADVIRLCEELPADRAAAAFFESRFYSGLSPERKEDIKRRNPQLEET